MFSRRWPTRRISARLVRQPVMARTASTSSSGPYSWKVEPQANWQVPRQSRALYMYWVVSAKRTFSLDRS